VEGRKKNAEAQTLVHPRFLRFFAFFNRINLAPDRAFSIQDSVIATRSRWMRRSTCMAYARDRTYSAAG
jgi:hypothetical protein